VGISVFLSKASYLLAHQGMGTPGRISAG